MIRTIRRQLAKVTTPALTGRVWGGSVCVLFLCLLISCTGISEEERYIYMPPVRSAHAVLIEDFTGQRCINCPNAALEIEKLKEQYGADTIIAVGIHSGPLAVYSRGNVLGLRTEEGDEYYEHWKIEQEPMGYINRRGSPATPDQWGTLVREAIQVPTDLKITLAPVKDSLDSKLRVHLIIVNGEPIKGRLQLWLTESKITALQMMPDGTANPSYVHNHVFRRSINGTWGEDYVAAEGEIRDLDFECELDETWKPENLAVVAFIESANGVEQVAEKAIIIQ